jgi:sorbitol/mannitol transport system permease protein
MADSTSASAPAAAAAAPVGRSRRSRRDVNTLPLLAPSVVVLLLWMIVPLALTLWFSFQNYNLVVPTIRGFAGFDNYTWLLTDPALWTAMLNTLLLVGGVLIITVVLGVLLAVLFDQEFFGCGVARLLAIAPFFVMPTVSALIWKNMLMHPVNGLFAWITTGLGLGPIDWFANLPMTAIIIIVAWQWTPFALLILLTAIQSLDTEQKEAARMDGAGPLSMFWFIILPHLGRAISVVVMIETIFFLTIFAEIFVTTSGGPGLASTNLAFLIYIRALLEFDVGGASAGGVIAIVLANIVAIFLIRAVARNLDA